MFFDFFWGKNKVKKGKEKIVEKIKINDDNGELIEVDKKKWLEDLEQFLASNASLNKKYDKLELAISYGVSKDVVTYCLRLYSKYPQDQRCANLLFQCYEKNGLYSDAIDVYEKYSKNGNSLTYAMYYEMALAQEQIGDIQGMEKSLFFSISLNKNYTKALYKLKELIKKQYNSEDYLKWLQEQAAILNSWFLYKEIGDIYYKNNNLDKSIENYLKSLQFHLTDDHLYEVAKFLLINNRYVDFENYILPLYDISTNEEKIHQIILNFYFKDNQCDKGLNLLYKLYERQNLNENFYAYEKQFLKKKLKNESLAKYNSYLKKDSWGKTKSLLLKEPIYNMLFKEAKDKKNGKTILILPFVLNTEFKLQDKITDISKNIHLYLNEKIDILTNLRSASVFLYDDLGVKLIRNEYSTEYFERLKKGISNLDMILTGQLNVKDELGSFEFKIFTYDLNAKQRIERFKIDTSCETFNQAINKFFNSTLEVLSNEKINKKDIEDKKFMEYYSDYIDIILNVFGYNKYRVYEADKILRYYLKETNINENTLNIALSLIKKISSALPIIKERYNAKIYEIISKGTYSEKIFEKFYLVFGDKNEENSI